MSSNANKLLTMTLGEEQDIVAVRHRTREVAAMLGFDNHEQTRITTAVSEIARNAYIYARGGKVEFLVDDRAPGLEIHVIDSGPGIGNLEEILSGRYRSSTGMGLGIIGARRLMDRCEVRSEAGNGTQVILRKDLPGGTQINGTVLSGLAAEIAKRPRRGMQEELHEQNQELLRTLAALRERQEEMLRLNSELEDTNRGVVALYAELDEKADSLRRADETKSRFLSNMSHEFRTPLNSIRALTRLLLARTDGDLNAEQEKQMRFINKASEDLTALVDDLLDIAKIEAGKTEVHPVEFTVDTMFSTLRGMLRPLLVAESVRLVFEDPHDVPPMLTDEGKVAQILRNFISNALKYTERGEVRVSATHSPAEKVVRFSVADTGIGIAPEDQERVFEEFHQVANRLQSRAKGTGLGLPLCRRLVGLLGGAVTLTSERDIGSTFTAIIPLRYPALDLIAQQRPEPSQQSFDIRPEHTDDQSRLPTILIIDDDASARYVLGKLLASHRLQVREAEDGIAGLQSARTLRPDLIFLDIKMPNRNGAEVLADLKNDPATSAIPVVMISTLTADLVEEYELKQATAVLSKDTLSPEIVRGLLAQTSIPYQ